MTIDAIETPLWVTNAQDPLECEAHRDCRWQFFGVTRLCLALQAQRPGVPQLLPTACFRRAPAAGVLGLAPFHRTVGLSPRTTPFNPMSSFRRARHRMPEGYRGVRSAAGLLFKNVEIACTHIPRLWERL